MAQGPQVKFIKVSSFDSYVRAKEQQYAGAIVFAEFVDSSAINNASNGVVCPFPAGTKLIYANGIEYNVTNLTKFSEIDLSIDYLDSSLATLYEIVNDLNGDLGQDYLDLSTYVHTTVDGSISDISTRLASTSTRLNDASVRLANVSTSHNDLSTYVRTTVNGSISDISARLADASTRLSGALKNASIYAEAGADSSVKITLVTNTVGNSSLSTDFKVNGSEYVNVQYEYANGAVSVALQNITTAASDITETGDKLVKAGDLYAYVTSQINNLEGALQFKTGIADASTMNAITPEIGDVYVATGEFEFKIGDVSHNVESGDLLIYGNDGTTDGWVIVERNLDGAVEATATLTTNKVVVGDDKHTVKTTAFELPTVDNSIGIKNASSNSSILTTQYAVRDYVDNELAAKVADVKVTATTGTSAYVDVTVDPTGRDISVGVKTASLGDYADLTFDGDEWKAADGTIQPDGLATAGDVARAIQDNELVVAAALNTFKDKIGLASDLAIDWEGKYTEGTTIVDAIKDINVADNISTAIEDLDSSVVAAAGKVLTKVVQENGKLTAKEEATLTINNRQFTGSTTALTVEIDGSDIKLMSDGEAQGNGVDTEDNPTVKQAILDLRGGKIGAISTGNAEIHIEDDSSTELASRFTQHTISSTPTTNVSKDASILTELLVTKTTNDQYIATALATDAYVQEQIATAVLNTLCWEEF